MMVMKVTSKISQQHIKKKWLEYATKRMGAKERRYKNFQNEFKYAQRLKTLTPDLKLLDVGCGPGLYTTFWIEQGIEGYGIDVDFSLIRNAKKSFENKEMRAQFVVGSVEMLPYKDSLFDICIANGILEHVQDWQMTLKEVTRILKPNGLLLLSTTNKMNPFQGEINNFPFYPWIPDGIKKRIMERIMKHRPDLVNYTEHPAIHWFTFKKLRTFLEGLGYKTYNRLDMIEKYDLKGWKKTVKPFLPIIKKRHFLRYVHYFYSPDVAIYAQKLG
jgi:2-polyprenyl-3-methyl-5-hydroxy-6-metoxy-1,4-benzoquinol methylase